MSTSSDPEKHRRRSIRLRDYDYSREGVYCVTVCTDGRELLFGEVKDDEMALNELGRIAEEEWLQSARIRIEIELDALVVMPNHVHGIVIIGDNPRRGDRPVARGGPRPRSLGAMMAGFKSAATRRINTMRGTPGASVWQRNYYEHIVRNQATLDRIRQYITDNPAGWMERPGESCHWGSPGTKRRKGDRPVAPTMVNDDDLRSRGLARRVNAMRHTRGASVRQCRCGEHVIRKESALYRIQQYIADNPVGWPKDPENLAVWDGHDTVAVKATGRSP